MQKLLIIVGLSLACAFTCLSATTPGQVVSWNPYSTNIPIELNNVVAIAASTPYGFEVVGEHALAVKNDGTVLSWIIYDTPFGAGTLTNIPADLSNVVSVGAAPTSNLALKRDGTVVKWNSNGYTDTSITASLTNITAILPLGQQSVLKSDGTVFEWGSGAQTNGQGLVTLGGQILSNVTAIAAGSGYRLALKNNGTVVAWGTNSSFNFGQTNVPVGLSSVIAIGAGGFTSLAVRSNGTVVAWGDDTKTNVPPGLSNVIAVCSGGTHSLALKSDGAVVGWGNFSSGAANIPAGLSNVVAIAAGFDESLTITIPLKFSSIERLNEKPLLRFHTFSGQKYSVEYLSDLNSTNWANLLGTNIVGNGYDTFVTDTNVTMSINRFYRLKLVP